MTIRDTKVAIIAALCGSLIGVCVNKAFTLAYVNQVTAMHESCVTTLAQQERSMRQLWQRMDSPFVSPKYAPKAKRS